MIGPEDTMAVVKAYIQEKTGFYPPRPYLWDSTRCVVVWGCCNVLRDNAQTLSSLGIEQGPALILRYGGVYKVALTHTYTGCIFNMKIKPGDTIGGVKAVILKKAGILVF